MRLVIMPDLRGCAIATPLSSSIRWLASVIVSSPDLGC